MNDSTVRDIDDHEKDVALRVDFSAIVQFHVSEVVHTLVAEHDRIMEALWSENQNLRVQMGQGDNKAALNEVWEHPVVLQDDKSTNLATGKSSPVSLAPRTSAMNTVDSLQFHPSDSWWKGRLKRMILSGRFDSIVGGIIVLNTLVMSLELEYSGRKFEDEVMRNCVHSLPTSVTTSVNATTFVKCEAQSDYYDTFFIAMEHFFTGAFALELFLRLVGLRLFAPSFQLPRCDYCSDFNGRFLDASGWQWWRRFRERRCLATNAAHEVGKSTPCCQSDESIQVLKSIGYCSRELCWGAWLVNDTAVCAHASGCYIHGAGHTAFYGRYGGRGIEKVHIQPIWHLDELYVHCF